MDADVPQPGEPQRGDEPAAGRHGWPGRGLLIQLPFLLVLLVAAVGFERIVEYHWRQGSTLIGGALLLAALLRALVPPGRAGLLAIRTRAVDVLGYGAFGLLTVIVSVTIVGGPFG